MFLTDWEGCDTEGVLGSFCDYRQAIYDICKDWESINILLASYTYGDYSGDAFVLFEQDGKLYEVHGGHCSCYGLEGQWEPEETSIEALDKWITDGYVGNSYREELEEVVNKLKQGV